MIYNIENENLRVQINSLGAELWSIIDKSDDQEYLWQGDKAIWPRRAPILFPYCAKLKDNKYILNNKTYESPIHGFARDFEHSVKKRDETSVTFMFSDNEETHKLYPYRFRLLTKFQLNNNQLTQSFRVENASDADMAFSIGYHTGYRVPFEDNHSILDYNLVFERNETPIKLLCNHEGLLTGQKEVFFENQRIIPLSDGLFPSSFILSGLKSDYVSIMEAETGKAIRIGIKGFPYVVFWSTPNKVNFVCVEPWHGLPDSNETSGEFDKKPGILKLPPGKQFVCEMTIQIIK